MLTSVKSRRSATKIFIKILSKEKRYSSRKLIREFSNKNWNRRGLGYQIKKIDQSDSTA